MTAPEENAVDFAVDIPMLGAAISRIESLQETCRSGVSGLKLVFNQISDAWQSPSGDVWSQQLVPSFNRSADALDELQTEAIARMKSSYNTYTGVETTNVSNVNRIERQL